MATASNEIKNLRRDLLSANEAIEELQYELKRYQDNLAEAIAVHLNLHFSPNVSSIFRTETVIKLRFSRLGT